MSYFMQNKQNEISDNSLESQQKIPNVIQYNVIIKKNRVLQNKLIMNNKLGTRGLNNKLINKNSSNSTH